MWQMRTLKTWGYLHVESITLISIISCFLENIIVQKENKQTKQNTVSRLPETEIIIILIR